ncbi:YybH family protein [Streptomyces sp. NPDC054975]
MTITQSEALRLMSRMEGDVARAMAEGDAAALTAGFAPDALLFADQRSGPIVGREAIAAHFGSLLDEVRAMGGTLTWRAVGEPHVSVHGDLLLDSGIAVTTVTLPDGTVHEEHTNELVVWRLIEGEWLIVRQMSNRASPPEPAHGQPAPAH